jgi:hypothetical protein
MRDLLLKTTTWVGNAPLWLQRDFLAERGISLALQSSGERRPDSLASGSIQGATLSTLTIAQTFPAISPHCHVLGLHVQPIGRGLDRVAAVRGINNPADLHRARVAANPQSTEWGILERIFDEAGLPLKKDYLQLPSRDAYVEALRYKVIDAAVLAEPHWSAAMALPDLHEPASIAMEPIWDMCLSLLVVRRDTDLERWNAVFEAQERGVRDLREGSDVELRRRNSQILPEHIPLASILDGARFFTLQRVTAAKEGRSSSELVNILEKSDSFYARRTASRSPAGIEAMEAFVLAGRSFSPVNL